MKTLDFNQMGKIEGGWFGKFMCNAATSGIGAVYGSAMAGAIGGPVGIAIGVVFGIAWGAGLSTLAC